MVSVDVVDVVFGCVACVDCEDPESPDALGGCDSLAERVAPFSPARRLIHRLRVGLKGATGSGKTADASTAGGNAVSDEARSEVVRKTAGLP